MGKKGYTLIELLAVLSIMAVILLIAVPSITKQLSSIEDNNYTQFKQNIYLAAESYINANPTDFAKLKEDNGEACIDVENLVKDGWLKSTMNNPKTNDKIAIDSSVKVININGEYNYTYRATSSCNN